MKITVIPSDRFMSIDGKGIFLDVSHIPGSSEIHAIQWDTDKGHIERPGTANMLINGDDFSMLAPFIAAYEAEAARIAAENEKAEWTAKGYKLSGAEWVPDRDAILAKKIAQVNALREQVIAAGILDCLGDLLTQGASHGHQE